MLALYALSLTTCTLKCRYMCSKYLQKLSLIKCLFLPQEEKKIYSVNFLNFYALKNGDRFLKLSVTRTNNFKNVINSPF